MKELIEKPFASVLIGDRVQLRLGSVTLVSALWQAIKKDREMGRTVWPRIKALKDVKEYVYDTRKNPGPEITYFMYNLKDELIGTMHLHTFSYWDYKVELGYWVVKSHEGKGYASESLALIEEEIKSLGFHRAEIRCDPKNEKSMQVAFKNGYKHEGTLVQDSRDGGIFRDTAVFGKIL